MEREYNVPLRREWLKVPRYKRAKKAVTAMKQFLAKHMKSENVKLSKEVNEKIWGCGMRNPPHHVKVLAVKNEEGVVVANLFGAKAEKETKPAKEVEKPAEKKEAKPKEEKVEEKKKVETPKEKPKTEEKVEAKA